MPQLTTLDVRDLNVYRNGGDEGQMEDGVSEDQKQSWKKSPQWGQCPRCVQCLVPVVALWLVIQEETYFLEDEGWLLLAGMLFTGLVYLYFAPLLKFLYQYSKQNKHRNVLEMGEIFEGKIGQPHHACPISQQDTGHLLLMVRALLDGLVVSLLQEPVSDPRVSQIQDLITKLEAISKLITAAANNNTPIEEQALQTNIKEDKVIKTKVEDRLKHICTYLQERVSDLRCLLQTQDQYGACIASVQQELLEYWELLEDLHAKVTLQPEMCQDAEEPHTVLTDTESLYTKLGQFQSRIHECQVHLSTSTHLLEELENKQQVLAQTVGLTAKSTWIKDLLQCNTQQFEKVFKDSTSLSQQTLTFVMHLQDLSVSKEKTSIITSNVKHAQSSLSPLLSFPVYNIASATERTPSDPELSPPHTPSSKFSVKSLLCGVRRRK